MDADRFVILLILLSICSGWFSYSYRQKVFIDSKKSERFTLKKTYILKVFLVSISSILILAYFDFNPSLIWLIFINLFVSFIYVSYWKQKKLYLSYASESIVIICMFVAILLSLLFSISFFELLVYCALVFLVAIIIFLRKNIKITLKFDQDSAIVSLSSFLIILISNIEVLAMENLIGSGDIVIFRYVMIAVIIVSTVASTIRQRLISKNFSLKFHQTLATTLLTFLGALILFSYFLNSLFFLIFTLVFAILYQLFLSLYVYELFLSKKEVSHFVAILATLIFGVLYIHLSNISTYVDLLHVKLYVISFNILCMYLILRYLKLESNS